MEPLQQHSLTKVPVLQEKKCSNYRRKNNKWKGQVSLSLHEISQQFLEWNGTASNFPWGA